MSLLSRLFGKTEASSEILCPHCERSMDVAHDVDACARKRMSRRYFFGIVGGAAALLAIPHPKLHTAIDVGFGNSLTILTIRQPLRWTGTDGINGLNSSAVWIEECREITEADWEILNKPLYSRRAAK